MPANAISPGILPGTLLFFSTFPIYSPFYLFKTTNFRSVISVFCGYFALDFYAKRAYNDNNAFVHKSSAT